MHFSTIEPLEHRIAPAAVATFGFTDRDGDDVVAKITTPTGTSAALELAWKNAKEQDLEGIGLQLTKLNLTNPIFANAKITITAKVGNLGGDGFVAVGTIDATGNNLNSVVVDGDLAQLKCGTGAGNVAIKSLTVQSMGAYGLSTGADGPISLFDGTGGKIVVKEDLRGVQLGFNRLTSATVGGSVIGVGANEAGIYVAGNAGTITVNGSLIAADGDQSGAIFVSGDANVITIGGSVYSRETIGLDAVGQIRVTGDIRGKLSIKGNVYAGKGGYENGFAQILIDGDAKAIQVGGSIIGVARNDTSGVRSGRIEVDGAVGSFKVGGDILGSAVGGTGTIELGSVQTFQMGGNLIRGTNGSGGDVLVNNGVVASIKINGSIIGGAVRLFGPKVQNIVLGGSIIGTGVASTGIIGDALSTRFEKVTIGGNIESTAGTDLPASVAADEIGILRIKGDIVTGDAGSGLSAEVRTFGRVDQIIIDGSILGNAGNTAHFQIQNVGSILVKKDVQFAEIAVTSGFIETKSLIVNGDWTSSRFAMDTSPGPDTIYGTSDDELGVGGKIAKIVIKGQIAGTFGGTDSYRIFANHIGSATVNGIKLTFGPGAQDFNLGITGDVKIIDAA